MAQHDVAELTSDGRPVKVEVANRDSRGAVISTTRVPRRSPGGADMANDPYWGNAGDGTSSHAQDLEDRYLGYATLDANSKIYTDQLPDWMLGQVLYGGTINASGVVSPSDAFAQKFGASATLTITANGSNQYNGFFFIANGVVEGSESTISAGTDSSSYPEIKYTNGDWIISNGSKGYAKIDNSDAVQTVFGLNGTTNNGLSDKGIGSVVLGWKDVKAVPDTYLTNSKTAPSSTSDDDTLPTSKAVYSAIDVETTRAKAAEKTNADGVSANATAISTETQARTTAEQNLQNNINSLTNAQGNYLLKSDYKTATVDTAGTVKVGAVKTTEISASNDDTDSALKDSAARYYAVQIDSVGKAFVDIPWANTWRDVKVGTTTLSSTTKTTLEFSQGSNISISMSGGVVTFAASMPTATNSVLGIVKAGAAWDSNATNPVYINGTGAMFVRPATEVAKADYSVSNAQLGGIKIGSVTYRVPQMGSDYDGTTLALGLSSSSTSQYGVALGDGASAMALGAVAIGGYSYNSLYKGAVSRIANVVSYDAEPDASNPSYHLNKTQMFASAANIFFRNADLSSGNTTLDSYSDGHTLEDYLLGAAPLWKTTSGVPANQSKYLVTSGSASQNIDTLLATKQANLNLTATTISMDW